MRYIVVFLVLLNIGYFVWSQFVAEPFALPEPAAPRPLLNSGITLVSEFEAQLAALPARQCFTVASFSTTDDANSFISELGDLVFDARIDLTGEALSSQYRVYLPPLTSRGIATITLDSLSESLEAAEMQVETYLITRGPLENGIALGVFSQRENAVNALEAVQGLGFAPEIEEIPRSTGEIQVQLQLSELDVLENPEWAALAAARPDLTITENLCETIAQGSQFP